MTESIPDVGMDAVPSGAIDQPTGVEQHPSAIKLADSAPLYWALLDDQDGIDHGPGVIARTDAQNAQTLLRRAAEIDKDAVMACAGQTKAAARATLLGILAREPAS